MVRWWSNSYPLYCPHHQGIIYRQSCKRPRLWRADPLLYCSPVTQPFSHSHATTSDRFVLMESGSRRLGQHQLRSPQKLHIIILNLHRTMGILRSQKLAQVQYTRSELVFTYCALKMASLDCCWTRLQSFMVHILLSFSAD